jgi:hypothetical protein
MKNRSRNILFIGFLFCQSSVQAFDIKGMFEGMGTSFGAAPIGYNYSFAVWSDASIPIYIEQHGLASFMGAFFPSIKGYYGNKKIPSIFEAPDGGNNTTTSNAQYYFDLYIGTSSSAHANSIYKQSLTQLPLEKNDPNVYYYHVYTSGGFSKGNSKHEPKVEMMGYQNPNELNNPDPIKKGPVTISSQLSDLSFYNSSGSDVQVSLKYGTDNYTFTLEKYSYNSLAVPTPEQPQSSKDTDALAGAPLVGTSNEPSLNVAAKDEVVTQGILSGNATAAKDPVNKTANVTDPLKSAATQDTPPPPFSLRPNNLNFTSYEAKSKKYVPFSAFLLQSKGFDGSPYTIEIFQDAGEPLNVGIQGLNPGNYDLPITPRVRDLTPCPCTFWYQSFEQGGSIEGYSNLPGQMWIVYAGVDSPIQTKVEPGQAFGWNLVRPLVSQGDQYVYFVYVATTDDAVAQNFVAKLAARSIGQDVAGQYEAIVKSPVVLSSTSQGLDVTGSSAGDTELSLTPDQQVAALMGNLQIADGVIEDTDQGIIGYIVGADVFTPKGLGFGRFHYVLAPSVISMNNLISLVQGSLDSSKTATLGASDGDMQKAITQQVNDWFTAYLQKPADVQALVEKFLIQYGNTKIVDAAGAVLTKFGQNRLQDIVTGKNSLKFPSMKLSTVTNQYVYDFGKAAPEKMPSLVTQKDLDALNNTNVQAKQAVTIKGGKVSGADRYQAKK